MAQEDAGRAVHSSGTEGWQSSAHGSRSNQSHASPGRERRPTNSTYKNGDGSEFPRYFMQLGQDIKRTRGYEMIQELQLMICNKESGIRGNSARARCIVLLQEVQGVLIGLENKVDAQTYDLGVFGVERTELRKELRDQKAKEFAPLHTTDFRSTEVKDLPHKLRTLFEDNQILREQVRHLRYSVRSAESRLEASEKRSAALETEVTQLGLALREAGSSPDLAHDMRQLREAARGAETRAMQLEVQILSLNEQLESERRLAAQRARHAAAKAAMLESRLAAALSTSISPPPMPGRKASGRAPSMYDPVGMDDGGDGRLVYGASFMLDGGVGGGGVAAASAGGGADGRSSAHSRTHTNTSAAARSSAGRERSVSPPHSPSGRSISHNPGSAIPSLYPLFNTKPRPQHAFSSDSPSWLSGTSTSAGGGGGSGAVSASIGGGGGGATATAAASGSGGSLPGAPALPPAAPGLARSPSVTEYNFRPAGGPGGPVGRPSSGSGNPNAGSSSVVAALVGSMDGLPQDARPASSSSTTTSSPGELVRALNSTAVVTSRTLLPSVSGASGGGGGRLSGAGSGSGILSLRVGALAGSAGGGGGGGGGVSCSGSAGGGLNALRHSSGSDDFSLHIAATNRGLLGGGAGGASEALSQELASRMGCGQSPAGEEPGRVGLGGSGGAAATAAARDARPSSAAGEGGNFGVVGC